MDGSLKDQVALVTGATKGIGLAIARELAGHGATVLLNYRRDQAQAEQALAEIAELSPKAALIQADVADPAQVTQMFKQIRTDHGRLDLFVNNAGVTADGFAVMMGEQKWNSVIDTNLTGSFLCCRAAGRLMASAKRGSIVAIASTSGISAPAGQANYAASKAGLLALVRVLAKELGQYGIRVNAVVPGFVDTAMTRAMPQAELAKYVEHIPLGRVGTVAEIAPLVRFLLSDEASYLTGTAVVADGGLTS